jgi:cell wall-associated NlpC family hydrolase
MFAKPYRVALVLIALAALCLALPALNAADRVPSLMERIEADIAADPGLTPAQRAEYTGEFRLQLAAYGRDLLRDNKARAADVLMTIVTEGSFDEVDIKRTVVIATEAYIAIARGSDPVVVEGIALYGFRKKISADKIEAWANGYAECVKFGVPPYIAEDLVYNALERDWDITTYNILKWGLVDGAKSGFDMEAFQTYLIGTYVQNGKSPGTLVRDTMAYFKKIRKKGTQPKLPPYQGSFIPRKQQKQQAQNLVAPPATPKADQGVQQEAPNGDAEAERAREAAELARQQAEAARQATLRAEQEARQRAEAEAERRAEAARRAEAEAHRRAAAAAEQARLAEERARQQAAEQATESQAAEQQVGRSEFFKRMDQKFRSFLGVPYVWGGETRQGTDCSGFTQTVFSELGVKLPRVSRDQWQVGTKVTYQQLRKGDLVFFKTVGDRVSHVGIVSDGPTKIFVHASSSKGVTMSELERKYWKARYAGARRVIPDTMLAGLTGERLDMILAYFAERIQAGDL